MTIIGIDFGLVKCCMAVWDPKYDRPQVINGGRFNNITPSFVGFTDVEKLIGDESKSQCVDNVNNTFFDIKRLLCQKGPVKHASAFENNLNLWPFQRSVIDFKTKCGENELLINVEYKRQREIFKPIALLACLLNKLKTDAEDYLQETVTEAVVSIPSSFNYHQRTAMRAAALAVGLRIVRLISDGAAAMMTYNWQSRSVAKTVLTFDLGGGNLDVSIAEIEDNFIEMKASVSRPDLGGVDFGNRIVDHFVEDIRRLRDFNLEQDPVALAKLRFESERVLAILSRSKVAHVFIQNLVSGFNFETRLTRAKLEEICADLFRETLEPVEKVLRDAKLQKENIDEIVLLGRCSRIPKIQQHLQAFFDGKDLNESLHPEEAVACGASMIGGRLARPKLNSPHLHDLLILTVTQLSVGIEIAGGKMSKIVNRNTALPTKQTQTFYPEQDCKNGVLIKIFEGERLETADNIMIGFFVFNTLPGGNSNLAEVPLGSHYRGDADDIIKHDEIEVTFDFDCDGLIQFTVHDKRSSVSRTVEFKEQPRMHKRELGRMTNLLRDDETEQITARNKLRAYITETRRRIDEELTDRITYTEGRMISTNLDVISEWMKRNAKFLKATDEYTDRYNLLKAIVDSIGTRVS